MEGVDLEVSKINHRFIRWPKGRTKSMWRGAKWGWKALKLCVELMETKEIIAELKAITREELCEKKGLHLRKKVKTLTELCPLHLGSASGTST